jgi:cell division protein FtsW
LFAALAFLGIRTAARAPDRFGRLLAIGITCWIVSQAFINIGAVIGLLPVTGLPLPFVSFGGSSLVIIMAATGILLSVAARERPASNDSDHERVAAEAAPELGSVGGRTTSVVAAGNGARTAGRGAGASVMAAKRHRRRTAGGARAT